MAKYSLAQVTRILHIHERRQGRIATLGQCIEPARRIIAEMERRDANQAASPSAQERHLANEDEWYGQPLYDPAVDNELSQETCIKLANAAEFG